MGTPNPVAQYQSSHKNGTNPEKDNHFELLHSERSNITPHANKEKDELLLHYRRNNLNRDYDIQLIKKLREVFRGPKFVDVYLFFLEHGASTSRELIKKCKISSSFAHSTIQRLSESGLIEEIGKTRGPASNAGSPVIIHGVPDATKQEIDNSISRYMKTYDRIYGNVERFYQRTLIEIKDEEIQYKKIIQLVQHNSHWGRNFHYQDIADEIARRLHFQGVKVWR